MTILKGGVLYFALVFGAGFVFGTVRVLWAVPRLGERAAELMEMPLMLVVMILAARWITGRLAVAATPFARLGVGFVALGLLLAAEFAVVLRLRGIAIDEYLAYPAGGHERDSMPIPARMNQETAGFIQDVWKNAGWGIPGWKSAPLNWDSGFSAPWTVWPRSIAPRRRPLLLPG
jgi:hypothetical protein